MVGSIKSNGGQHLWKFSSTNWELLPTDSIPVVMGVVISRKE
jgi:hypothetical protein